MTKSSQTFVVAFYHGTIPVLEAPSVPAINRLNLSSESIQMFAFCSTNLCLQVSFLALLPTSRIGQIVYFSKTNLENTQVDAERIKRT